MAEKIGVLMEGDRGAANGVATLGADKLLTESQRPDYPIAKVEGLQAALDLKAVKTDVDAALKLKADQAEMNTALGLKADQSSVESALALKADQSSVTSSLALKANQSALTEVINKINGYEYVPDGAGPHNCVYRGKDLGTTVTAAQWTQISAGTFKDLFIGDFWTINSRVYRIAAFDYYYRTGYEDKAPDYGECKQHHLVMVPDVSMYSAQMNATDATDGAYMGSDMYKTHLNTAKTTLQTDFAGHLMEHWEFLANAATAGYEAGRAWAKGFVNLMTEDMVYGTNVLAARAPGTPFIWSHTVSKSQLPLFTFRPDLMTNRQTFWLQDVCTSVLFANADYFGRASCYAASYSLGVRPAFTIS